MKKENVTIFRFGVEIKKENVTIFRLGVEMKKENVTIFRLEGFKKLIMVVNKR